MDETKELLYAISKNLELVNAKLTATQDELLHFRNDTVNQFRGLRGEVSQLKTDVSELKTDVSQLKTDVNQLKTEFSQSRNEFSQFRLFTEAQFAEVKTEFRKSRRMEMGIDYDLNELTKRVEKLEAQ